MKNAASFSIEELRAFIRYDATEGRFFWLKGSNGCPVGKECAVNATTNGHRTVRVRGRHYTASRLAWLLHHGEEPGTPIRFRDGDKTNVRIANLFKWRGSKGYDTTTHEGRRAAERAKKRANPERYKGIARKWRYGIAPEEYAAKILAQDGKCAICRRPETATMNGKLKALSIDHDHSTGAVRDLLCRACNCLVGYSGENIETLRAAIAYLNKHNGAGANVVPLKKVESA